MDNRQLDRLRVRGHCDAAGAPRERRQLGGPGSRLNVECVATAIDRVRVLRFYGDIGLTCRVKR